MALLFSLFGPHSATQCGRTQLLARPKGYIAANAKQMHISAMHHAR